MSKAGDVDAQATPITNSANDPDIVMPEAGDVNILTAPTLNPASLEGADLDLRNVPQIGTGVITTVSRGGNFSYLVSSGLAKCYLRDHMNSWMVELTSRSGNITNKVLLSTPLSFSLTPATTHQRRRQGPPAHSLCAPSPTSPFDTNSNKSLARTQFLCSTTITHTLRISERFPRWVSSRALRHAVWRLQVAAQPPIL